MKRSSVGVVGARGYVGSELLPMLVRHPELELAWVTSSSQVGEPVVAAAGLSYVAADPSAVTPVDVLVLALPNGESARWVERAGSALVVDLSTDHRFDPAWVYAQPERFRDRIRGARRLSCPGCYATAAQLAIAPVVDRVQSAHVFGVSGYSGAGTARTERNDPEVLRDNLLPYALVGHAHERELTHHLGRPIRFVPHVAPFFRGLSVTVSLELDPLSRAELEARYADAYAAEPFVELGAEPPRPRDAAGTHGVRVGGLARTDDGAHVVVVAALDNLLGGAASQALRATNLALGFDESLGLEPR